MKKYVCLLITVAVLLTLFGCAVKSYDDLTPQEKRITSAAGSCQFYNQSLQITLNGDPVLVSDYDGNDYEFIPVTVKSGEGTRSDVVMAKNETFICFDSEEIDYLEVYINGAENPLEMLKKMQCKSIWGEYETYKEDAAGKRITDDLRINEITVLKRRRIEGLVNAFFSIR